MSYAILILTMIIGFVVFGSIGKIAIQKFEVDKLAERSASLIITTSMLLWFLTAITCVTTIAFKINLWIGWIVGGTMLLWLVFSALPSLSEDTRHSIELARKRRQDKLEG